MNYGRQDFANVLRHRKMDEGNWEFDGDSYIPDDSIDVYNNEYGENYIVKDY